MTGLFVFGTLLDSEVRGIVAGAEVPGRAAVLPGWTAVEAKGGQAALVAGDGVEGLLIEPDANQLARLDYFLSAFAGDVRDVTVTSGGTEVRTRLYTSEPSKPLASWSFDRWSGKWHAIAREAAREAMTLYGRLPPKALAQTTGAILARAAAAVRARADDVPMACRVGFGSGTVEVLDDRRPYSSFFSLHESDITHPRFDGGRSQTLTRTAFGMGDAVTVLPYDPVRDRVLLVEQFRFGPFVRGDFCPWLLEAIAGRIDPGETPESTALREAVEEAGLHLARLLPVSQYYPSPGAVTEYIYSFVGIADLPDGLEGTAGLEEEDEDIRSHVMSFARFEQLIASGEVNNGPLLLSAYWLAGRRQDLTLA